VDLIAAEQAVTEKREVFTRMHTDMARGNGHKLLQGKFCLHTKKKKNC